MRGGLSVWPAVFILENAGELRRAVARPKRGQQKTPYIQTATNYG